MFWLLIAVVMYNEWKWNFRLSELEALQHASFEQTSRIEMTARSAAELSSALVGTDAHERITHENQRQIDELARRFEWLGLQKAHPTFFHLLLSEIVMDSSNTATRLTLLDDSVQYFWETNFAVHVTEIHFAVNPFTNNGR